MPKLHWRQPGFIHSPCETFSKNKETTQKFKGTGDSRYIYQNKLDKGYFQHDKAYENFKEFPRKQLMIKCNDNDKR